MLTGTIKFFNKSKGFGFITADGGGKEVFLPSATVTASGLKKIEPGQRVSFQEEADVKGPKAVALTLLDEPRRAPPQPVQPRAATATVTLYGDPASSAFETVREALAAAKADVALVDVSVTPPEPLELKKWSLALSGSGASLVRRSDSLFFALQLDDRFISESDFWLAISQHPTLINGPVLKAGGKLAIARTADDVRRFLGAPGDAVRSKGLSPRLSAMIRGEALPPEEDDDDDDEEDEIEVEEIASAPVKKAEPKAKRDVVKAKPAKTVAKTTVARPKADPAKKAPAAKAKAKKR